MPTDITEPDTERDPDTPEPAAEPDGTPHRRLAVSLFIVVTLAVIVVSTMPTSALRSGLLGAAGPVLSATGLDQDWGVFAPSPPRRSTAVIARVDHLDGTSVRYPAPDEAGLSAYWNFRWRKYGDYMPTRTVPAQVRTAYASWIADRDREAGGEPVRVTLIKVARVNLPPGPGPDAGLPSAEPFHTVEVAPR